MDDRLYRSRTDRMLTGVAGGLAERLDVDPALVRVVWAVSMPLTGFLTLLIYVVMALVVPDEPGSLPWQSSSTSTPPAGRSDATAASAPDAPSSASTPADDPSATSRPLPASALTPPPTSGPPPTTDGPAGWPQDRRSQRAAWRAARRAQRGQDTGSSHPHDRAVLLGLVLVGLGLIFLAQELIPSFDWGLVWPIAAICLGLILIADSLRGA